MGMNIVCVRTGHKYGTDYVYKLQAACERHIEHDEFWCMTDYPEELPDMNTIFIPAPVKHEGWWSKMQLFGPMLPDGGWDWLYIDLDVVITAPIPEFIEAFESDPEYLWALDDFSYSLAHYCIDGQPDPDNGVDPGWLGGPGNSTLNSSVMMFLRQPYNWTRKLWDKFEASPNAFMDKFHGDQNFLTQALWPDFRLLPGGIAKSYKYGNRQEAPIVIFHGEPKPADVLDPWVLEHWRV